MPAQNFAMDRLVVPMVIIGMGSTKLVAIRQIAAFFC